MTLIHLRHSSPALNRESILREGLTPHKPTEDGRYRGDDGTLAAQPRGVYAYIQDGHAWSWNSYWDQWEWFHCGPLLRDPIIGTTAVVAPDGIPAGPLRLAADGRQWS